MAVLLVGMSIAAILLTVAMPVWKQMAQREKEEELVFRGKQYVRALRLFSMKYANASPPNINVLVEQRYLRKKYKDPITNDDFQPILAGQAVPGGAASGRGGRGGPGASGAASQGFPSLPSSAPSSSAPSSSAPSPSSPSPSSGPASSAGSLLASPSSLSSGSSPSSLSSPSPQGARGGQPLTGQTAGRGISPIGTPGAGPTGGIIGVVSKSKDKSIRLFNGRNHYNEWAFIHTPQVLAPGVPGQRGGPGAPGVPGQPGGQRGRGQPGGPGQPPGGGRGPGTFTPFQPAQPIQPVQPGRGRGI